MARALLVAVLALHARTHPAGVAPAGELASVTVAAEVRPTLALTADVRDGMLIVTEPEPARAVLVGDVRRVTLDINPLRATVENGALVWLDRPCAVLAEVTP